MESIKLQIELSTYREYGDNLLCLDLIADNRSFYEWFAVWRYIFHSFHYLNLSVVWYNIFHLFLHLNMEK